MRLRCALLSCVLKNSFSVSFFQSFPNQSGSLVSRLLTTVRNLSLSLGKSRPPYLFQSRLTAPLVPALKVAQIDSSHRGLRQLESLRYLTRGRTLAGLPTISSNRLLNGAFEGSCSIFSTRTPHPDIAGDVLLQPPLPDIRSTAGPGSHARAHHEFCSAGARIRYTQIPRERQSH